MNIFKSIHFWIVIIILGMLAYIAPGYLRENNIYVPYFNPSAESDTRQNEPDVIETQLADLTQQYRDAQSATDWNGAIAALEQSLNIVDLSGADNIADKRARLEARLANAYFFKSFEDGQNAAQLRMKAVDLLIGQLSSEALSDYRKSRSIIQLIGFYNYAREREVFELIKTSDIQNVLGLEAPETFLRDAATASLALAPTFEGYLYQAAWHSGRELDRMLQSGNAVIDSETADLIEATLVQARRTYEAEDIEKELSDADRYIYHQFSMFSYGVLSFTSEEYVSSYRAHAEKIFDLLESASPGLQYTLFYMTGFELMRNGLGVDPEGEIVENIDTMLAIKNRISQDNAVNPFAVFINNEQTRPVVERNHNYNFITMIADAHSAFASEYLVD